MIDGHGIRGLVGSYINVLSPQLRARGPGSLDHSEVAAGGLTEILRAGGDDVAAGVDDHTVERRGIRHPPQLGSRHSGIFYQYVVVLVESAQSSHDDGVVRAIEDHG